MEISERIRQILNENSGGIKMNKLILELATSKNIIFEDVIQIENIISSMPDIKILTYTWHNLNREKQFVYTP